MTFRLHCDEDQLRRSSPDEQLAGMERFAHSFDRDTKEPEDRVVMIVAPARKDWVKPMP
jgi:hypothetical protein